MFDDDYTGLNFWPAFADFMLALLLVFLTAFGIAFVFSGPNDKYANDCQDLLKTEFKDSHPGLADETVVQFQQDKGDPFLFRIRFQDRLLFDEDDEKLRPSGREVLGSLAQIMRKQLDSISEIQINGHADVRTSRKFRQNLRLASERAQSVFWFLKESGVNPSEHVMSATSYGEFYPVGRHSEESWTQQRTEQENSSDWLRQRNRRVELVLRYGQHIQPCVAK